MRRINAGLYVAFGLLVAGITLSILHSGAWFFAGLAGTLAVLGSTMMEITEPDRGAYMLFGRYMGAVDPGWHFPIGGIMDCCHRPGKDVELDLGEQEVFTAEETGVTAKVLVTIRLGADDEDLKKACLRLPKTFDDALPIFMKKAASEIRSVVGKKSFQSLIPEQEKLEEEALKLLKNDFAEYGFVVVGVKIYDFNEEVKSEAARIKIQGLAEAEVRKANAAVLKDNWQAAAVTIGDSLARAYSSSSGGKKKKNNPPQESADEQEADKNPVAAVVDSVAQAARDLAGGRRRS